MKNIKGIWFFGPSGSGKTFASEYLKNKIKRSFLIDGDEVRNHISTDLGFDKISREIQIQRIFGLSKICLINGYFCITSSVYMNQKISKYIFKEKIMLCYINRNLVEIEKHHPTYTQNKKYIVGKDIKYENFDYKIINNNEGDFCETLNKLIV